MHDYNLTIWASGRVNTVNLSTHLFTHRNIQRGSTGRGCAEITRPPFESMSGSDSFHSSVHNQLEVHEAGPFQPVLPDVASPGRALNVHQHLERNVRALIALYEGNITVRISEL